METVDFFEKNMLTNIRFIVLTYVLDVCNFYLNL